MIYIFQIMLGLPQIKGQKPQKYLNFSIISAIFIVIVSKQALYIVVNTQELL